MNKHSCDTSRPLVWGRVETLTMPSVRAATVFLIVTLLASALAAAPRAVAADAGRIVVPTWGACCAPPIDPTKLELVDPAGGGSQPFVTVPVNTGSVQWPSWSGDATRVAFWGGSATRGVVIKPVNGSPETDFLPQEAGWPSWSPVNDEIAYWLQTPNPIFGHFSWTLKVTTADGLTTRTVAGPYDANVHMQVAGIMQPAWSPDGKTIAFALDQQLVRVPAAGGAVTQLVAGGAGVWPTEPSYSPDGKRLAYEKLFVNQGRTVQEQLVARDLATGAENVLADTGTNDVAENFEHGPQSWSPDSKQIAYAEQHSDPSAPCRPQTPCSDPLDSLMVVNATGGGGRAILQREHVDAPAWSKNPQPNYYIKHIEVAQAISPDLEPLAARDPLLPNPDTFQFQPLSAHGFSLPLVAGKSTLLRIYVGDARLPASQTVRQLMHFRVFDQNDPSITYEATEPVDVTAPDVAPAQATERAALNFWLPPEAAQPGALESFKVDINTDENGAVQPECGGCFPNGNEATVQGVRFEDGGSVVIAPVPIYENTPDSRTVLQPDEADFRGAVKGAIPMLPIPDRGLTFARQPGPGLLIDQKDKMFTWSAACELLLAKLEEYRALPSVAGPVEGLGATRWVGYAPPITAPDGSRVCKGGAKRPGRNLVLLGPTPESFAHEFGHTLGLTDATGRDPAIVPARATPLGYPGIGGVGYGQILGHITKVFDKATTGDLMSYDEPSWTSPKTWHVMHEKILAESGAIRPQADVASAQGAATRLVTRRLVTGILRGNHTTILDSLVTQATNPASFGPTTARVVARDERGNTLAQAPIRGTLAYEQGESQPALPFVVALRDNKKIASLEVLPAGQGKPLAQLHRSKHPPTGKLVGLPRRASATRPLTLRWRATDRDHADRLSVAILGRRGTGKFRALLLGPAIGRMVLDPRTLGKGKKLSVRLLVSDGLTTTVVNARAIKLGGRR